MVTFLDKCSHKTLITARRVSVYYSPRLSMYVSVPAHYYLQQLSFFFENEWIMNELNSRLEWITSYQFSQCVNASIKFPFFSRWVCVLCMHFMYQGKVVWASANRTTRQPEGIWYRTVKLTDDFIYAFLPAGVAVSPSPNGRVKLPQSHFWYLDKPLWDLQTQMGMSTD